MHSSFDAIIIGAGPIGCTVAAVLSATNKNVRICVLDGRPDPTRNHGLKLAKIPSMRSKLFCKEH